MIPSQICQGFLAATVYPGLLYEYCGHAAGGGLGGLERAGDCGRHIIRKFKSLEPASKSLLSAVGVDNSKTPAPTLRLRAYNESNDATIKSLKGEIEVLSVL